MQTCDICGKGFHPQPGDFTRVITLGDYEEEPSQWAIELALKAPESEHEFALICPGCRLHYVHDDE